MLMMENATSSEVMDNFIFQTIKPKAKRNFHPHPVTFPVRRQVLLGKNKRKLGESLKIIIMSCYKSSMIKIFAHKILR